MLSHAVFRKREKLHVSHTGIWFRKPLGRRNDPMVLMGTKKQREATVNRILIAAMPGERLPDLRIASSTLNALKREADFDTRDLLHLNYNNFRNYLLEVPESARNEQVVHKFLDWLETQTIPIKRSATTETPLAEDPADSAPETPKIESDDEQ